MNYAERIMPFKKILTNIWVHGDQKSWPISTSTIADILFPETYEPMLSALLSDNNAFVHPAMIFRSFDYLLRGIIQKREKKEENQKNIFAILQRVQHMKAGDCLNRDGRNTLWNHQQVENFINAYGFIFTHDAKYYEKLSLLIVLIRTYIELIYFRLYDISQNIHGLYDSGEEKLLIYEFENLNAMPFSYPSKYLSYKNIHIGILYSTNVNLDIDIYNHIIQKKDNLKSEIKSFLIIINDKVLPPNELDEVISTFQDAISSRYHYVSSLDRNQIILSYITSFAYKMQLLSGHKIMSPNHFIEKINSDRLQNRDTYLPPQMISRLMNLLF